MTEQLTVQPHAARADRIGARIVCGLDGSDAGAVAAAQAAALAGTSGSLTFVSAIDPPPAWPAEYTSPMLLQQAEQLARDTVASARRDYTGAHGVVELGPAAELLTRTARQTKATLVAVGTHGRGRTAGILLGSTATTLLHDAPCSVLVARPCANPDEFPRTIVVGSDGSPSATLAVTAAQKLAQLHGADLRVLAATGADPVDVDGIAAGPPVEWSPLHPLEALVHAGRDSDLLVVGSRGLRGLRALGSVSERIGHEAPCSVLVVRAPLPAPDAA